MTATQHFFFLGLISVGMVLERGVDDIQSSSQVCHISHCQFHLVYFFINSGIYCLILSRSENEIENPQTKGGMDLFSCS